MNMLPIYKTNNAKNQISYVEYYWEGVSNLIQKRKIWTGYEEKQSIARINNIDMKFPLWEFGAFQYIFPEFIDVDSPGSIYLVAASTGFKKAGKMRLVKKGSVDWKTPMGDFDCDKYVFYAGGDPFLYILAKSYIDAFEFYYDKKTKRYVGGINKIAGDIKYYLAQVTNWKAFVKNPATN
jgi:hypothetical protein